MQVNHSTDPSHKPCNLIAADTHVYWDPQRLPGTSFVFEHSVTQIRLQAEGLNLLHHKWCWFEKQLSLKCQTKAQKVFILNKSISLLDPLKSLQSKKYFQWHLLFIPCPIHLIYKTLLSLDKKVGHFSFMFRVTAVHLFIKDVIPTLLFLIWLLLLHIKKSTLH